MVLVLWALWYAVDPALRSRDASWTHLVAWFFSPLALYLCLARHKEPPASEALIGREGRITELDPLQVEVFGSFWQARSPSRLGLKVGDRVRVSKRDGLTLIVEPLR